MNQLIRAVAPVLGLSFILGCIVVPGRGGTLKIGGPLVIAPASAPDPGPPPPRLLSQGEAVAIGMQHCQNRSYPCDLREANLTGNAVWKLRFKVRDEDEKGHVHMDVDARNGAVLKVDEKVKMRSDHGRGRKHD